MARYIDLDKLTAHLSRAHKTHFNDGRVEYSCGILLASDIAYNEPKVDLVEVVRCKDCKHWAYEYCTQPKLKKPLERNADDYCSYGEREESKERSCETCAYYNTDRDDQPCCGCVDGANFESEVEGE